MNIRIDAGSFAIARETKALVEQLLTAIFVDSSLLYRVVRCHQRADRSFSVRGRQFHICARCTGLVCGIAATPALFFAGTHVLVAIAAASIVVTGFDGVTQQRGYRNSSNIIRVCTGAVTSASVLALIANLLAGWK
ncbi:MAG TPA: DUF2085 domain-containing protein [Candidatus Elarobacter sp.]